MILEMQMVAILLPNTISYYLLSCPITRRGVVILYALLERQREPSSPIFLERKGIAIDSLIRLLSSLLYF